MGIDAKCHKEESPDFVSHIRMAIDAQCTWGEGPDIILSGKDKVSINLSETTEKDKWTHGVQKDWSVDLSKNEAKALIGKLILAVAQVEELEELCKIHDDLVMKQIEKD